MIIPRQSDIGVSLLFSFSVELLYYHFGDGSFCSEIKVTLCKQCSKSPQPPFQGGAQRLRVLYPVQKHYSWADQPYSPLKRGLGGFWGINNHVPHTSVTPIVNHPSFCTRNHHPPRKIYGCIVKPFWQNQIISRCHEPKLTHDGENVFWEGEAPVEPTTMRFDGDLTHPQHILFTYQNMPLAC